MWVILRVFHQYFQFPRHYIRDVFIITVAVSIVAGSVAGVNIWRIGPREERRFRSPLGYATFVITVALFVTMALVTDNWALLIAGWILITGLVSASWIDLLTHRLPRQVSYLTFVVGLPFLIAAAFVDSDPGRLLQCLFGVLLATAIVGVLYLIGRGALGAGDVRLAPTLGLYLGWHGLEETFRGILFGFVLAGLFSIGLLLLRRRGRRDEIPMGPFLVIGTLGVFLRATALL